MGRTYDPAAKRRYYQANKQRIAAYWKDFYAANRERLKTKQKKQYREKLGHYLFYAAKARAKRLGIPFNLEKTDIVIPARCPVFNHTFIVGHPDWAPSIDRIRPTRGYTKGNVVVVSFRANKMKGPYTLTELKNLVHWLETVV